MDLSTFIKKYRKENKITMQELAEKSGLSKGYISMIESGKNPQTNEPIVPTLPTINKLAIAMEIDVDSLLRMISPNTEVIAAPKPAKLSIVQDHSPEIAKTVKAMHRLDYVGQEKVTEYAEDLVSSGKYSNIEESPITYQMAADDGNLSDEDREAIIRMVKEIREKEDGQG